MAAMLIVMVVFLVVAGHHGFGGSHDAKPAAAEATHMHSADAAKPEEQKR